MKDNINIEELFKSKFENFEGNVDPSAWANIQQGMNATGAGTGASAAGLSGIAKVAIVSSVIAVTAVSVWYFSNNEDTKTEQEQTAQLNTPSETEKNIAQPMGDNILATDTSDPVIQQLVNELDQDLKDRQYNADDIDEELVESVLFTENNNNSNNDNSGNLVQIDPVINNDNNNDPKNVDVVDKEKEEVDNNPEVEVEKKPVSSNLKVISDRNKLNTFSFKSNAKNHLNVSWEFGDETYGSGDNVTHTYEKPGEYQVVMTVNGDEEAETVKRKVIVEGTSKIETFANIFTPNGDGRNDYFFIESEGIEKFYISIKDERGNEVFTSNDVDFEWNGADFSGTINKGKFIVVIIAEGEDGQVFKEMKALRIE